MIEGKTKSGFKYKIADDVLDDMELIDALVDMDEGGVSSYKRAMRSLLGEDQVKSLYEFMRDKETGKVSASKVFEAFGEILESAKGNIAIKN